MLLSRAVILSAHSTIPPTDRPLQAAEAAKNRDEESGNRCIHLECHAKEIAPVIKSNLVVRDVSPMRAAALFDFHHIDHLLPIPVADFLTHDESPGGTIPVGHVEHGRLQFDIRID